MSNTATTLKLPVQITHRQAQTILQQLKEQLLAQKNEQHVYIDAAQLAQFDSSALALLLALKRITAQQHKGWKILNPPQPLSTLTALYGMQDFLALANTQASA